VDKAGHSSNGKIVPVELLPLAAIFFIYYDKKEIKHIEHFNTFHNISNTTGHKNLKKFVNFLFICHQFNSEKK